MKKSNNYQGWYVLVVKSLWEKKVHSSLNNMGIESFLPLKKEVRQWSDRKKTIYKPLFPSYVLVNINSSLEFYKALTVNGCFDYIRFGKKYARVTEKEINQIKFLVGEKDITDIETHSNVKIGEHRKITCGPFMGLDCEIIKIENRRKIIVRLGSLNMNILATIPLKFFGTIK